MMIETERLILRKPEWRDADDFFDIFSDAETCRSDGGYAPLTRQNMAFDDIVADAENRLFIVEKASEQMIGVLHFMPAEDAGEMEIGYVVHRDFRRRGYAAEAVSAAMADLAARGIVQVRATVYHFNAASRSMLEKLGFVYEGIQENKDPEWNEAVYRYRKMTR